MSPHRPAIAACLLTIFAAFAAASPASAAVPDPASVTNPVIVSSGGDSLGEMRFTTTFDGANATGRAASGTLRLRSGTFRLRTCVSFKSAGAAPESVCEQAQVKVNFLTALTGVSAPVAQMTVPRPASGRPAATIAGRIIVDQHNGSGWSAMANSWPMAGLPAAGVAVPPVDQRAGAVLAAQGGSLGGVRPGGINDRTQDSICLPESEPGGASRGSASALGTLPFPYEVQEPPGKVRGTMILLHGGGWFQVGHGVMEGMRGEADRWLARGWRTVNSSYRACGSSSFDVVSLYDRVVETYGRKAPICASGQSSGGHLALLLAALRTELACAISEGGPSDLVALANQTEPDSRGVRSTFGPVTVVNMATAAFGADRLAEVSPTRRAVKARVLFALAKQDVAIPFAQATGFAAAQKARDRSTYVDTVNLSVGDVRWVHGLVSEASLSELRSREKTLIAPLVSPTVTAPSSVPVKRLRRSGLRVSFSCPTSCSVTARLKLRGRTIATAKGRRSAFGPGKLTLRLNGHARKRVKPGRARLVAEVRSDGTRKRKTRRIKVRR